MHIICLNNVLQTSIDQMKENVLCTRYVTETITNADYADNLSLLANILSQAKFLLRNLNQAARGIGLYMNSDKTEYMCVR